MVDFLRQLFTFDSAGCWVSLSPICSTYGLLLSKSFDGDTPIVDCKVKEIFKKDFINHLSTFKDYSYSSVQQVCYWLSDGVLT